MIGAVTSTIPPAWPDGWEHVEVVDSVLVEEPAANIAGAGLYDGLGRRAGAVERRYGALVSVLA